MTAIPDLKALAAGTRETINAVLELEHQITESAVYTITGAELKSLLLQMVAAGQSLIKIAEDQEGV